MNLSIAQKLLRFHWFALALMLMLCTTGIFFIYSATHLSQEMGLENSARQQCIWLFLGLIGFFTLALINYEWLIQNGPIIFLGSIILLLSVIFFGTEIKGAKSWIRIGPVGFQPAEFSKIAFVVSMSWLMLKFQDRIKKFPTLVLIILVAIIPVGLILAQGDFGSASVYGPMTYLMLVAAGIRKRWLALPIIGVIGICAFAYFGIYKADWNGKVNDIPRCTFDGTLVAMPLISIDPEKLAEKRQALLVNSQEIDEQDTNALQKLWEKQLLKPYQVNRIRTFFEPELDPLGAGWTIRQSLIAVGSGGLRGKGYMRGEQQIYGFLPKDIAHNDFIFAVIAEETGFLGGSILIATIGFLLLFMVQIAVRAKDIGGCLLVSGIGGLFFAHFLVNVGMTIKVVPITGIPLPLISYGGTFLVTCMAGLGIVQSVWIHRRDY
ncbi:MAG: rod shape-determining protein RodA [Verrucomicrobiota bacterium]